MRKSRYPGRATYQAIGFVLAASLIAVSCSDSTTSDTTSAPSDTTTSTTPDSATSTSAPATTVPGSTTTTKAPITTVPKPGYGGAAKVGIFDSFPGFCVGNNPANSALMATRAIYETLFEKTIGGDMVGLLAKSASPSSDLKTWTITLREGITFHDGAPFDAAAVVTNFNAITGRIAAAAFAVGGVSGLGTKSYTIGTGTAFTSNIVSFSATSPYVVRFNLDRPQNDFPATLYASGRFFMRSPAQFASSTTCATSPIGTGPFKIASWTLETLTVTKNASYWRRDPNTNATLPYLDKITFTNIKEGSQRAAAVRRGTIDAGMFAAGSEATFIKDLRLRKSAVTEYSSPSEYYPSLWLNQGKPGSPFANKSARQAVLSCLDRVNYAKARTRGETAIATSIVGPKSIMYTTKGFPKFDPVASRAFVEAYKTETKNASLTFSFPADTSSASQANARFLKNTWSNCGITANIVVEETAIIISKAFNASPKIANGEYYNAYDMIPLLLFEGNDVAFNLPFIVTNAYPATSTNPVKGLFQTSVGAVLSLTHHSDTTVDTLFYAGQAADSKSLAKAKYALATEYLQDNAFIGALVDVYYSVFTTKKLGGVGTLQIEKGKTQRAVTNWGIDWTGVYKTS
jgi:glutathione transport system substrate-binding protein